MKLISGKIQTDSYIVRVKALFRNRLTSCPYRAYVPVNLLFKEDNPG